MRENLIQVITRDDYDNVYEEFRISWQFSDFNFVSVSVLMTTYKIQCVFN